MDARPLTSTPFKPWPSVHPPSPPAPRRRVVADATVGLFALYRRCNPDFRFFQSVPRRCLTRPSDGVCNNDYDNINHDYILYVNDTLSDDHGNQFAVLDLLGTGTFGQVVKCRHQRTGDIVAIKVIKNQPAFFNQAWVEINILRMLHRNNNPEDTKHVVKFYSHFVFRGHLCLVFERLSINLYELLKQNNYEGVSLDMLRNFVTQILHALNILVRSEVIHCDLKPENILLKALDTTDLKIIDFGSACQLRYPVYSYVQSRFYRSPEVLLGLPDYDSKIDMWSLGCVVGELFLGIPLFPGQNEMNLICRIVEMLGDMPDRFLHRCRHTHKFFNSPTDYADGMHVFHLKTLAQYEQENNLTLPKWKRFFKEKKLRDIIMTCTRRTPELDAEEVAQRESLIDLLTGMLKIDPLDRWTPGEAMQHPFIKGLTLPGGQPWVPQTRLRRIMRSRPVVIDMKDDDEPSPVDSMYSASAPNFTAKGRLALNSTWGTGAGGQPTSRPAANTPYLPHVHGNTTDRYGQPEGPVPAQSFAPGSYVPSTPLSMFDQNLQIANTQTVSRRNVAVPGSSYGGSCLKARPFLYPPGSSATDQLPRGGTLDSPSGPAGSTGALPAPCSASRKLGGNLHISGSKESLTGSLGMSGSRESLVIGRTSSVGDMGEDPMFGFGSDDEVFSSTQGMTVSQSLPVSQPPLAIPSSMGASAALPPPGPRLSLGRSGSGSYGNAAGLSSYGYSYTSNQQTRTPNISVGSQSSSDVTMPDANQTIPQPGVRDKFGAEPNENLATEEDNASHDCPSNRCTTNRGP